MKGKKIDGFTLGLIVGLVVVVISALLMFGCAGPSGSFDRRSVEVQVSRCIRNEPGSADWWRYLAPALDSASLGTNLAPAAVGAALRPANKLTSGQFAARAAAEAERTFRVVWRPYVQQYRDRSQEQNREALRILSDGIRDALRSKL